MISVQGKFLCNNITEGFTFFRYNRDTKFERGTKHWQKEWQVSIKKDCILSSVFPKNRKEKFPTLGMGYSHISAGNIFI